MLQIGGLGLMGVSLPRLLRAENAAATRGIAPRADACIIIFLNGGASHLDTWDMKPEAPDGIRGEFKPIPTSLPGVQFSEHLPRLATHMHRLTLVRSMHHSVNNAHAAAVYTSLTGHDRGEIGGGTLPTDNPSPGSVMALVRPPEKEIVPHVTLPYITKEGAGGPPQPGFFGGLLGHAYDPLFVLRDPNSPDFAVPELTLLADVSLERLAARKALLSQIDRRYATGPGRQARDSMDRFQQRALDLLTSETTQQAFRLSAEPDNVRESYGRNIYGQSVLLARRMIEAGTRLVTISWAPDANATWDTHGGNFTKLKGELLPKFDSACTSLITDLADRGMLDRTLVAVLGDFGRTPKINNNNAGRDHWNFCYSILLAGGGFKPGFVYGASDKIGAFPARSPMSPGDCVTTIYHALGIDAGMFIHDQFDRPHRLVPKGDVVVDLLS
ncbi:MAG: DUF1501 domain-containing protein [Planctomycetia bacterium]|nr:DUF1501 domain-containing protein [Planctomycetia bacterium]